MVNPIRSLSSVEYKIHSQNGEDGIIDCLVSCLPIKKKTFVEIGCGTGNECNTTALLKKGWSGVVFDRKPKRIEIYKEKNWGGVPYCGQIIPENIEFVTSKIDMTPDLFSLDIDSYDYWVMKALLEKGFSPAICVLEYNKDRDDTVEYPFPKQFRKEKSKPANWGCGLKKWKELLSDYTFITVDSTRINCFFVRGTPPLLTEEIEWLQS